MSTPFVERLILDEINLKVLKENKKDASAFSVFRGAFLGQLWNTVKANWLMLAFCIPIVVWLFLSQIPQANINAIIPYSGNLGIGYPVINNAAEIGLIEDFNLAMQRALIMLPCIVIGSAGLAGVFNVVKYLCWGMQVKILKTFFKGVKNSMAPFILMGAALGLWYLLFTFCLFAFDIYALHLALKVAALIIVGLLAVFLLTVCLFMFTQGVMFDLSVWAMLKNSLMLVKKFVIQNTIITILGAISMSLLFLGFNEILSMIAMMLFFMTAFGYMASVWTAYSHGVFTMLYEVKKAHKTAPIQITPDGQSSQPQRQASAKKAEPAYKNPKKGKK